MLASLIVFAALPFGHDHYLSRDGAWCWFADPRAVWINGHIINGAVSKDGDIVVSDYDPATKKETKQVLAKSFEKDDHDNPTFLRLIDGRIAAFYSKHTGPDMWMQTTVKKDDVSEWTPAVKISPNDPDFKGPEGALNAYTYPNPQMLSEEKNRIYLFWRGMNWKPTMSWSDDQGRSWKKGAIIVSPSDQTPSNRPYLKAAGNGKDTIHLAFTDGHPRNEPTNSIYYAKLTKGNFFRANNTKICAQNQIPFQPSEADVIYDGRSEGVRAWIWDIASDRAGSPVVVYTRLPKENEHIYRYARWNGQRWVDRLITNGGKWFPNTPEGKTEQEPHYSGGVVLDPNDTRFVYLSRPINGRFEIERWFTPDGGDTWSHVAITGNSKHDSVRPFVIRGERPTVGPVAAWMNMNNYVHYTNYAGTIQAAEEDRGPWTAENPKRTMEAVWKWVRSNPTTYTKTEWMLAPLYSGVLEFADRTGNDEARTWMRDLGESLSWKFGPRPFMADDQAVGQSYLHLYALDKNPAQLAAAKTWADAMLLRKQDESLEFKGGIHDREWAWCDSLFMAPPVLAMLSKATGERKYMELCDRLWFKTSDYLYDPSEQLYFRDSRYFNQKEKNGQKVFWSRGNGWVIAGCARVLDTMAKNDPLRAKFEKQFKEMASRIAELQTKDGTWKASLLDPASYPAKETSGTGFFCYALAWGINSGILDREKYLPVVNRAFRALTESVDPNGRLGYVQPIGQDPRTVKYSDTDYYGVGAFLLAGVQVSKL